MKFTINHLFQNVTIERFIETYFSEAFTHSVAKFTGLKTRTLVEEKVHPDGSRDRRVRMHPDVKLPAPIRKFATEDQIHYDEVSHYDAAKREVTFRIDSKANDRVKVAGTIRFVPEGSGVRRIIEQTLEVKAPLGLGGIIERFIEGEVEKGYGKIAPFLQTWLDEHQDPPAGGGAQA